MRTRGSSRQETQEESDSDDCLPPLPPPIRVERILKRLKRARQETREHQGVYVQQTEGRPAMPPAFATEEGPQHPVEEHDPDALDEDVDEEAESVIRHYIKSLIEKLDAKEYSPIKERVSQGFIWHHPQHPLFLSAKAKRGEMTPNPFYLPTVYFWNPYLFIPRNRAVNCCRCKNGKMIKEKTWHPTPRRIFRIEEDPYYIVSARMRCSNANCRSFLVCSSVEGLSHFPAEVQEAFPAMLTQRSALDFQTVRLLTALSCNNAGHNVASKILREMRKGRYDSKKLQYYGIANSKLPVLNIAFQNAGMAVVNEATIKFSTYDDRANYNGTHPSGNYIKSVLSKWIEIKRPYMDYEMQRRSGSILVIDHTFKITKAINKIHGDQIYNAFFSQMNEYSEISSYVLTFGVGSDEMKTSLIRKKQTLEKFKSKFPTIAFSDSCCRDRGMCQTIFPSLRDTGNLTSLVIPEDVEVQCHYTTDDFNTSYRKITQDLRIGTNSSESEPKKIIFLDLEWPVSYVRNQSPGKTSVIQMYPLTDTGQYVHIFKLPSEERLPQALEILLTHDQIEFVGMNIANDVAKLRADFGIEIPHHRDIVSFGSYARASLQKLCRRLLGYNLEKDTIDHKHWGRARLSEGQVQYAALDVIALKLLHKEMTQPSISPVSEISEDSSVNLSEEDEESIYSEPRRVKLDPVHWFMRFRIPKSNPFYSTFLRRMRDAVFILNPSDRIRVERVVKDIYNKSFESFFERNPRWVLERVRRFIPPPAELESRIREVLDEFKQEKYKDSSNDTPLLSAAELERIDKNLIPHVRRGCLSDVPDEPLYFKRGKDSNDLDLFRCVRGTNCLEGGLHKNLSQKVSSTGCSLKYADLFIASFIFRYNRDSSVRNRQGEENYGHYELDLCVRINELSKALGCEEYSGLAGFSKVHSSNEKFGIVPIPGTTMDLPKDDELKKLALKSFDESTRHLCERQGCLVPYRPVLTAKEEQQFDNCIGNYRVNIRASGYNYKKMADDWNLGRLEMYANQSPHIPDAKFVFRKTHQMLESYHNQYDKLNNKRISQLRYERDLRRLRLRQIFGNSSHPDMDVRAASNLTIPGESDSSSSDEDEDFGLEGLDFLVETSAETQNLDVPPPVTVESTGVSNSLAENRPLGFLSSRTFHSSNQATTVLANSSTDSGCQVCNMKSPQCRGGITGNCSSCPRCLKSSRNCRGASRFNRSRNEYITKDASRCTSFSSTRQDQRLLPAVPAQQPVMSIPATAPIPPIVPSTHGQPTFYQHNSQPGHGQPTYYLGYHPQAYYQNHHTNNNSFYAYYYSNFK